MVMLSASSCYWIKARKCTRRRKVTWCEKMVLVSSSFLDESTPLYIAAQKGHGMCVKMLLDKGAQVDKATSGETAR